MIDLRSDTVTLPPEKMKEYMMQASIGDDVYGEDPSINMLQEKAANLFNKEDALFVSSGTMANLISVLTHCNRGDEILLGDKSHIFYYEAGGVSAFGGIHSHQLKNQDDGTIKINLKLTREEMASYLGIATETFIRCVSDLKKENLITQSGRYIVVLDKERIVDLANID